MNWHSCLFSHCMKKRDKKYVTEWLLTYKCSNCVPWIKVGIWPLNCTTVDTLQYQTTEVGQTSRAVSLPILLAEVRASSVLMEVIPLILP